jgi:hypothetical protein
MKYRWIVLGLLLAGCGAATAPTSPPTPVPTAVPVAGILSVSNQTTLVVTVFVNGMAVDTLAPGDQRDPVRADLLPALPWLVEARSPSGRLLSSMPVRPGDVWRRPTANGGEDMHGDGVRVDLSCGRLDMWSGPPMAGPMPGPGNPVTACPEAQAYESA